MKVLQAGFLPNFKKDFFHSVWQLTQKCNFSCSYCLNKEIRKDKIHMSKEIMHTALDYISKLNRDSYKFSLSGGETTLYPHLPEMLIKINTLFAHKKVAVNLLTNGSATMDKMLSFIDLAPHAHVTFIITLHFEEMNIEKFIRKMLSIPEKLRKQHFFVKLVVAPNDKKAKEAKELLEASNIHYGQRPIIDFQTGKLQAGYSDDELDFFEYPHQKKDYFQMTYTNESEKKELSFLGSIRENMLHFRGMYCSAGYHSIYLNEYGSISKGQFCNKMPYTILEKNPFEDPLFFEPQKCREEHCTCVPFSILPKWQNENFAPTYMI